MTLFYHGTSQKCAREIIKNGFDVDARKNSDPGDFGRGIYITKSIERAKTYGSVVLMLNVDTSDFTYIRNPYFIEGLTPTKPKTATDMLFYDLAFDANGEMRTVYQGRASNASDRDFVCSLIRETFLHHGISGICTSLEDEESVIFDVSAIKDIWVNTITLSYYPRYLTMEL
jgi:hypothetical protein